MIRYIPLSIACLILNFVYAISSYSQFINIQIKIEPEITASVEQDLDFGAIVSNSGIHSIELGDFNMGIFSIKALHTQSVYLTVDTPEFLRRNDGLSNEVIPISLQSAYNNTGENVPGSAIYLPDNFGYVSVSDSPTPNQMNSDKVWRELFIYVFGYLDVGSVSAGNYGGDVYITVTYD